MVVNQHGVGGPERLLAQEPAADVLEHVHRDPFGAVAHRRDAEVGPVGDQRRRKGDIEVVRAGLVSAQGGERPDETAPGVHLGEQVLDPDPRQMGLDHPAQLLDALGDLQGIRTLQVQAALADRGERVAAEATLGSPDHFIKFACQPLQHPIGLGGEGQGRIGGLARLGPLAFLGQEVPERDMTPALGQVQVAERGASRTAKASAISQRGRSIVPSSRLEADRQAAGMNWIGASKGVPSAPRGSSAAISKLQIGGAEHRRLTDAEPGLEQELNHA